jgi:hypothetical protein
MVVVRFGPKSKTTMTLSLASRRHDGTTQFMTQASKTHHGQTDGHYRIVVHLFIFHNGKTSVGLAPFHELTWRKTTDRKTLYIQLCNNAASALPEGRSLALESA